MGSGDQKETFLGALNTLLETSSAHGLPNIHRSKSFLSKAAWTLLFFAGVTALTIQVISLVTTYLKFEYTVSLDVRFDRSLNFPAVTVCNINPVRKSKLERASDGFRELFDVNFAPPRPEDQTGAVNPGDNTDMSPGSTAGGTMKQAGQPLTTQGLAGAGMGQGKGQGGSGMPTAGATMPIAIPTGITTEGPETTAGIEYSNSTSSVNNGTTEATILAWEERQTGDFFKKRDDDYLKEQRLISHLANLTETQRMDMGHLLEDMLLDCQWQGYPCSPANFTSFYHYKFGNCYTFNSFRFGESLKTSRPGPLYGLTLELFLEQEEFMPEITEAAGFRLVVHDRDTMPFPEDDGISISPGSKTAITARVVTIERLGNPYGNCTKKHDEPDDGNIFRDRYGVSYSLKACERSCYQKEVISQCGCFDPHYPNTLNDTVYPCDIDNDEAQSCMSDLEEKYKQGTLTCYCFQQCNETTYHTAASSSIWPSDQFQDKLFRDIKDRNNEVREKLKHLPSPKDWVIKNVAKIEVYFQEFNFEYIKQSPAHTIPSLMSDIGGQLGLWLGLSILTVFELFEHCGTFLAVIVSKLCREGGNLKSSSSKVQKIKIFPTEDPGITLQNY
ncbi:degenerin mec-10-like [Acanthaster planci]|uniref:Degenerin mec-10-like n=1 Tax=Acanthaster planci TaxID=133434 RepID=A0A8B7ZPB7_ACAPL|nr:degenerin mec-10-like [Acanthaster planci]